MKTVISKRFKSVFVASIASMSISYVLILTDNVVAGQFVGEEAVAAMTLVSPIMTLIFFLSYMVADGLAMMFSYAMGKSDRQKANELFGMGVTCSVVTGAVVTFVLVVFQTEILSIWEISPELMSYAVDYYHGLMFVALPCILNIYFYTIYIAEGEEDICVKASIAMFFVNVILDLVLGYFIGVIGVGIATTIGNLVSFLFHVPYLFSAKCQLRFVKYWDWKEFAQGIFYSWYHSMDTLCLALLPLIFSAYVIYQFGEAELIVVAVIINMLTLLIAIYTGIVDCLQPMICQYHAENALHSVRKTMRLGIRYTISVTLVLIAFSFVFAEFLPILFGVEQTEQLYSECVTAVRIFMTFTVFLGVTLMFGNYYIYIKRLNLGALIKALLLLILPSLGMFAGVFGLWQMWIGVGVSFIVALLINWLITRRNFLLTDADALAAQFSFDTENNLEHLAALRSALVEFGLKNTERVEALFREYCARDERFQLEITITGGTIIFRDNGKPQLERAADKNYIISGDENKLLMREETL